MSFESSRVGVEDQLDALLEAYVRADQAPGLVYGLVDAGGLVHSAGFGRSNPAGATPDADTPFPIASMSKSFVAATTLVCRDRGLLGLDDPITDHVPLTAIGVDGEPWQPPTLRMLLSMSGGLTEDNSWVDPQIGMDDDELLALLEAGVRFSNPPGAVYEYSNLGYALVGLALERVTGERLETLVTRELLEPLGLRSTTFSATAHPEHLRAHGHRLDQDAAWEPLPAAQSASFAAAGGLVSTVADLARWVTWLGEAFRPGTGGDEVLSRAARRELQRVETVIPPTLALGPDGTWRATSSGYGLGLIVEHDVHRGVVVSHSGGLPGFVLHMRWHPASGHGLVLASNSHRGDAAGLAARAFAQLLAARDVASSTVRLWPETVRLRRRVDELLRGWTAELAQEVFAENVDVDRPLAERRAQVAELVEQVGPLRPPYPEADVVAAATPADVTWAVPGERGELVVMIHLTPFTPARVQELVVAARPYGVPRAAAQVELSLRRASLGVASLSAQRNAAVQVPSVD